MASTIQLVALLRGINVGGHTKIVMAELKNTFEKLGLTNVQTVIASGNVIFVTSIKDRQKLTDKIEQAIEKDFGFSVRVLLRSAQDLHLILKALPASWDNNQDINCHVMFLCEEVDNPKILKDLPVNPEVESVKYTPGALIWRIDRKQARKSRISRLASTKLYKQMTARNTNTVHKLYQLMTAK